VLRIAIGAACLSSRTGARGGTDAGAPKLDPKFGPKCPVTERNEAGQDRITSATKRLKIARFVTKGNRAGCAQSLNNYGKVLKTELRRQLGEDTPSA
jgi:hypothetical protein